MCSYVGACIGVEWLFGHVERLGSIGLSRIFSIEVKIM